jgi:hypothetical protein
MRTIYAISGAVLGALTDLLINLLAAAMQQRAFQDQFSNQAIGWLIGLVVIGLLLGIYLGKQLEFEVAEKTTKTPAAKRSSTKRIQMTRLRALFSYHRLRGQGIELDDILSIGSVVIIDSRD